MKYKNKLKVWMESHTSTSQVGIIEIEGRQYQWENSFNQFGVPELVFEDEVPVRFREQAIERVVNILCVMLKAGVYKGYPLKTDT